MIKKTALIFIFAILFLPLAQENLSLFNIKELNGGFANHEKLNFTSFDWFNGVYQANQNNYVNETFGFRNTLIRIYNEYRYFLYKLSTNKEAVFGKNNYLFAEAYINSYLGKDFIGNNNILQKSLSIKKLQILLLKKGIVFVPVLAPNKARIFSENIPDNFYRKNYTNYEGFVKCFEKLKINFLDFNAYFLKIKKTSQYPIYSKYGIHWSSYGRTLAADSIIKYLNTTYLINTPQIDWKTTLELSDSLRDLDYDIGKGLNLFREQLKSEKLAYPTIRYVNCDKAKPSLLTIGDSFNFGLEETDMQNQVFSNYKFLYYFKELRPYSPDPAAFYKLDLPSEITSHQVILLIATEHNLYNYGWGFVEKAISILEDKYDVENEIYQNKIKIMEFDVRSNKEWMDKIRKEAILFKKSLDSLVTINAKYVVDQKERKDYTLAEWTSIIRNTPDWMKQINIKAKERNITVDSMIVLDALYSINTTKSKK